MALLQRIVLSALLPCVFMCGGVLGSTHGSSWVVRHTSTDDGSTNATPAAAFDGVAALNQWTSDANLLLAKTMKGGDVFSVLAQMGQDSGLSELWSDPDTMGMILDQFPILLAIKGIGNIARHSKHRQLTAEDGANALAHLQSFLTTTTQTMVALANPAAVAQKFHDYANTKDPELVALFEKAGQGDEEAANELRMKIADRELVIDLDHIGHNGTEPEFIAKMRETIMAEGDDVFSLFHLNDPVAKRYMSNPNAAVSDAKVVSESGQSYSEM